MSGRGRGGARGPGRGGGMRHRQQPEDAISGIRRPVIRRLAQRGGVKVIAAEIYDEARSFIKESNGKACMGLRRCTVTPTSGLLKSGIGVPRCGIGTPKSSSRNSLFSPGEEFWNEAIQVADGLFDVVDKLPEGLTFLESGQASNKLLNDKISNHCLNQKTKVIDKTLSAVESNKESLLPVKHFDFSHEECNGNTEISSLQRIMEKSEAVRNTGIGLADSSSVNKKRMQTSNVIVRCQAQSSSQNLSEKMDSSINEPVDMKVDSRMLQ